MGVASSRSIGSSASCFALSPSCCIAARRRAGRADRHARADLHQRADRRHGHGLRAGRGADPRPQLAPARSGDARSRRCPAIATISSTSPASPAGPPAPMRPGRCSTPVAEEIARYISEARLERPAIVGHSMGGSWAMMVAGRHPGLVSRVMVVDMMPFLGAMFGGPTRRPKRCGRSPSRSAPGWRPRPASARRQQIEQTIATMVRTESAAPGRRRASRWPATRRSRRRASTI